MQDSPQRFEEDLVEIDLREYINLLWRKKWFLIGLVIVAIFTSYFLSKMMTKIYETSTVVMVREEGGMENIFSEQFSFFTGQASKVDTYSQILKSRVILQRVIKELDLRDEETGEYLDPEDFKESLSISGSVNTNLITITASYPDPVIARDIANKLVEVFKEQNQELNRSNLKSASNFISTQLQKVKEELSQLEEKLLAYKEENAVILPQEFARTILDRLSKLEINRAEALLALEEARTSLAEYEQYINKEEREIISAETISSNPIVTQNKARLVELEVELAGLLEVYTDKHPKVLEVKKKIAEVKNVLNKNVEEIISTKSRTINPLYQKMKERIINLQTTLIASEASISSLDKRINKLEEELSSLPEKELTLTRLEREARVAESIYVLLMERREELQIQEAMQSSDIVVVDPAVVEEEPVSPKTKLNVVIAAFLAIFIGVFIIFLQEYLDNTVKEEKDIENLTGLPVLGVIPDFSRIDHSRTYGGVEENV